LILTLDHVYLLAGVLLAAVSVMSLRDTTNPKRFWTALFWGLYALVYLAGELIAPAVAGAVMIAMALIAGFGGVGMGKHKALPETERKASAARLGNKLLLPALTVPVVTIVVSTLLKDARIGGDFLFDPKNITLVALACGAVLALLFACWLTRSSPVQGVRELRRLLDSIGWALVLPHVLAVLGLLFIEGGVSKAVAHVVASYVNMDLRFVAVAVYCVGMALFTIVMGNGFAAFPVMAGGVGIPVLVSVYHANPALMAAIGMFSAYCGTLMTPMAATFNIVPTALLELPDRNAVIKAQAPTALPLLVANIFLLYFLMDR
jgi:uncharacterized membrane protein